MTKIKFCGLTRACDIEAANELKPDYIGFVFWSRSKRYVTRRKALELKKLLDPSIAAVGVFVDEDIDVVKAYLNDGIIDIAQLHGHEDEEYIRSVKEDTGRKVIKAFKITSYEKLAEANKSCADYVLLDAGMGDGVTFDWSVVKNSEREYFLAGGLHPGNVAEAVKMLHPFAVDVSSGIETEGMKDKVKMVSFADAVRKEDNT
ncbi:MAG: phosphoribosylanthranilate isomerase [Saccharofermentans sp.]|nr:phosphoribosylanthranilate isomerase [Saccharofermentans sp.]